ncbi:MAG: zinc ribbon domain-containing protein [Lachnospiraceae bacterium]|nr:zinc ribbon domain-containing protein [Lachnospiraceae bacterium]
MNCPVCGTDLNGNQFCPNCGANMSAFEGVSQDKVIVNQTPAQQMAAGDDSVTQLIPENYMNSTGDDTVTQLIPENYMSAQGDDTATVMLDPNQVQQYTPNQQPTFAQTPSMNQATPAYGYQPIQPQFNQANYQSGSGQSQSFGVVKAVPVASKIVSLSSLIIIVALLVSCIVLITKPLFYITQSYAGGVFSKEEIEEAVISQDEDDYEEANQAAQIFVAIIIVLVIIAALNAWSCYLRISKGCVKSPVNKAVGNFVFCFFGVAVFIIFKSMIDEVVKDGIYYGSYTPDEAAMFNVYSLVFVLGLISCLVNIVNIITSATAKNAVR